MKFLYVPFSSTKDRVTNLVHSEEHSLWLACAPNPLSVPIVFGATLDGANIYLILVGVALLAPVSSTACVAKKRKSRRRSELVHLYFDSISSEVHLPPLLDHYSTATGDVLIRNLPISTVGIFHSNLSTPFEDPILASELLSGERPCFVPDSDSLRPMTNYLTRPTSCQKLALSSHDVTETQAARQEIESTNRCKSRALCEEVT